MFPNQTFLEESYLKDICPGLDKENLTPSDIELILDSLSAKSHILACEVVGYSYLGQSIRKYSWGSGPITLLCWSQMHGNESTATAAILDIFTTLCDRAQVDWLKRLQDKLTIHFVPMLNPDGAMKGQRENAQGIDINRDARALQSPEGRILNGLIDTLKPAYCFNLHDQNRYYRVDATHNPTTIAFLVPEGDKQGLLTTHRGYAIDVVSQVLDVLEQPLHDIVAKYNDTFSARAFGDYASSVGSACILIESGEHLNDRNRQQARWLNYLVLINAFCVISNETSHQSHSNAYASLPNNVENGMSDLLIRNIKIHRTDVDYLLDVGLRQEGNKAYIHDLGDLQEHAGFELFDAQGALYRAGLTFEVSQPLDLTDAAYVNLLKQGYCRFGGDISQINNLSSWPIVKGLGFDEPVNFWAEGLAPTCLFMHDDYIVAALLKGILIRLD